MLSLGGTIYVHCLITTLFIIIITTFISLSIGLPNL